MNRGRKSSPPPFYWKVPVPEKDHMTENYRRLRSIAAEGQKKRGGPLKANFVPGVTRNSKYDHIQSKVGESLKTQGQSLPHKSYSEELANRRINETQIRSQNGNPQSQRSVRGNSLGQQRLSRSSHDLRNGNEVGYNHPRRDASISASNGQGQRSAEKSLSQSDVPAGVKILQPNPPDESVFKWKFSDNAPFLASQQEQSHNLNPENQVKYPQQHCHRVEYLPCDGICADEAIDDTNLDSARSSSSRTSRGCNTEETRIINGGANQPFRYRSLSFGNDDAVDQGSRQDNRSDNQYTQSQPKQKGIFTLNGTTGTFPGNQSTMIRNRSSQNFNIITGNELASNMKSLGIRDGQKVIPKAANGTQSLNNVGAGDLPHSLGTVPKYLKQRQEKWREEECAKIEAEKNAHIPPGYMLMSEEQRMENVKTFKKNYDTLIAELNRLPIRIDTIRVRDHRAQLEKQLTRLEEAMKTFSRPKVWVKVDN